MTPGTTSSPRSSGPPFEGADDEDHPDVRSVRCRRFAARRRRDSRKGRLQGSPRQRRRGRLRRERAGEDLRAPEGAREDRPDEPDVRPARPSGSDRDDGRLSQLRRRASQRLLARRLRRKVQPRDLAEGADAELHVQEGLRGDASLQGAPGDGGVRRRRPDPLLRRDEGGRRLPDRRRPRRLLHAEGLAPEAEGDPEDREGRRARPQRISKSRNRRGSVADFSRDWLERNFPCKASLPGPHRGRKVRHADRRGAVPRGLRRRPQAESARLHLRADLRSPVRERLPPGRARRADLDPGPEAVRHGAVRRREHDRSLGSAPRSTANAPAAIPSASRSSGRGRPASPARTTSR